MALYWLKLSNGDVVLGSKELGGPYIQAMIDTETGEVWSQKVECQVLKVMRVYPPSLTSSEWEEAP